MDKPKLVLIIDDDNELVEFLQEILDSLDLKIEVLISNSSNDAINKIDKNINNIYMIFLDIKMNGKSGIEIYEYLRKKNKDIKVIFMSGRSLVEITDDKNLFFLHKPFTFDDIELLLEKLDF